LLCFPQLSHAQAASAEAESALRKTIAAFFFAWNSHGKNAWAEFLAQDIQWVFPNANLKKTRESVLTYGSINIRRYDVNFEVTKIKLYDEGTRATVLLRGQSFELPVRDGKYTRVWNRDLQLSRWRLEGSAWYLFCMNEDVVQATDLARTEVLSE
jgi:hypothetical protein